MMIRNSNRGLTRFFTILVVLMPLLSVYAFPGIPSLTLGEPFLLICGIFMMISSVYKKLRAPQYWLFVVYMICISLLNTFLINEYSMGDTMTTILRLLLYTAVIFMFSNDYIDFVLLRKAYLFVCFVSASYLVIQFISGTFLNTFLPSTFSSLNIMYKTDYTGSNYNAFLHDSYLRLGFRPSSFFMEPSHLSRYILYALPIIEYKKDKKSRYEIFIFIIVLVAVLINQSAMGFFAIDVFLITWLYHNRKKSTLLHKIIIPLFIVCLVVIGVYSGLMEQAIGRLSVENGSGGARLYRGFAIYSSMNPFYKIFGSGLGNFAAFANHYNINTVFDAVGRSGDDYMNLISRTLVSGGIVGFIMYIFSLVKLVWKKSISQITCFIIFIFFAFGSNILYYSPEYIVPMLFILFDVNSMNSETQDDCQYDSYSDVKRKREL